MSALNYKARFAALVESGKKPTTIRAKRKRPIRVGEMLHHFTGMRTKACRRLLPPTPCTRVREIVFWFLPSWTTGQIHAFSITLDGAREMMEMTAIAKLARRDGFESLNEFLQFFREAAKKKGRLRIFEGQLIEWDGPLASSLRNLPVAATLEGRAA